MPAKVMVRGIWAAVESYGHAVDPRTLLTTNQTKSVQSPLCAGRFFAGSVQSGWCTRSQWIQPSSIKPSSRRIRLLVLRESDDRDALRRSYLVCREPRTTCWRAQHIRRPVRDRIQRRWKRGTDAEVTRERFFGPYVFDFEAYGSRSVDFHGAGRVISVARLSPWISAAVRRPSPANPRYELLALDDRGKRVSISLSYLVRGGVDSDNGSGVAVVDKPPEQVAPGVLADVDFDTEVVPLLIAGRVLPHFDGRVDVLAPVVESG